MEEILRTEYPRPDMVRREWLSLNGTWEFTFGTKDEPDEAYLRDPERFTCSIQVPFPFQSELSGIGDRSPRDVLWYRRTFQVPAAWEGRRVLLHFGAVDYHSVIWVNGSYAGSNQGGYVPFSLDITRFLRAGENELVVKVIDEERTDQPRGKQSANKDNWACWYTRVSGIWQSVWLEPVSGVHVDHLRILPDIDGEQCEIEYHLARVEPGLEVDFLVEFQQQEVLRRRMSVPVRYSRYSDLCPRQENRISLPIPDPRLWSPEEPNLYDLTVQVYRDDQLLDEVKTYFGMRKIEARDGRIYLNNEPCYLRMVLDQGYFPGGIYTPRSVDEFKQDIELIKAAGFNGVRKHQKIEDPYFYYYCDRIGLLVWAEMPACYVYDETGAMKILKEWQRVVRRLYNFPSIIAWVPINESWGVDQLTDPEARELRARHHLDAMYFATKAMDHSRLVIGNDGWQSATTDILAIHDYSQDAGELACHYQKFKANRHSKAFLPGLPILLPGYEYKGQPIIVSEYGGVKVDEQKAEGWGYGDPARDCEEMLRRIQALTDVILAEDEVCGFCYTQLTDVEQEVNGLFTFDRRPKVPVERYAQIFGRSGPVIKDARFRIDERERKRRSTG